MTQITPHKEQEVTNWKSQIYLLGAVVGSLFGLLSAYLYARAAEEGTTRNEGKPKPVPTSQIISLGLAALSLARQIAEMGKSPKKK